MIKNQYQKILTGSLLAASIFIFTGCQQNTGSTQPESETESTTVNEQESNASQTIEETSESADLAIETADIAEDTDAAIVYASDSDLYEAYFSKENTDTIAVMYSHDAGESWQTTYIDYSQETMVGLGEVFLSFTDEMQGYLLYTSDAGAGQMGKVLYQTKDGGISFDKICDLTEEIINYPVAMAFHDENTGIILLQNHGDSSYAYTTVDAGYTWQPLDLAITDEQNYNYIEGKSITLIDESQDIWELCLTAVSTEQQNLYFHSSDGWQNWTSTEH